MHDRLSAPISVLWVMLILLLVPGVAETCVIAPRTLRAGQTFTVSVADRGRPVAGVELVLYGYEPESGTDKFTDEQGNVRFSGLNPGLYFLSPEHDAEGSDIVKVEVVPGDSTNVTIPVKWPRSTPIAVRSAAGQIRGPDFYPSQLHPQISLSLLESVSARALESIRADNKRRFAFKTSFPPGLYFIRLSPPGLRDKLRDPIEGLIAIELGTTARQNALDLDLRWSDCGLGYAQQEMQPDLAVKEICGDVTYETRGAIPKANVLLLTDDDRVVVVKRVASGHDGHFAFQGQRSGTYQLVIASPGLIPFHRRINLDNSGLSIGCQQPIHAELWP